MPPSASSRLVYSTDAGRICPGCAQPVTNCQCKANALAAQQASRQASNGGDGILRVRRENKGRSGKTVTTIHGAPGDAAALEKLGKQLKNACGSGGTVKDGIIEIQGDHAERVIAALEKLGLRARRSGG